MTVEREISSIETANINKETLDAMKGAQQAMKKIHGDLSIEKVDQTMEDLREQHAIGEEIADALTQGNSMQGVDEDELDEELAELQQEELDNKMIATGNVPVNDRISHLPNQPVGESKFKHAQVIMLRISTNTSQSKANNKKNTTRRRICADCRPRWQCEHPARWKWWGFLGGRKLFACESAIRRLHTRTVCFIDEPFSAE